MTARKKDLLALGILCAIFVVFFAKILFTHQIIRAPDIINEFYWGQIDLPTTPLRELFKINLAADWNMFDNSGETTEGGWVSMQFLLHKNLLFHFLPLPASVAWFILLYQCVGAAGAYFCARAVGASRVAAAAAGLIFTLAPENASLINAGHVLKMATISLAPWGFYFLERTFQTRRLVYAMTTAVVLAFQFFHGHWQISFYTCLCIGLYALARGIGVIMAERVDRRRVWGLVGLNAVILAFFLTTASISLFALASWSKETNRGTKSGANQGKGGLQYEEAMSWSLPPEELAGFVVPGFFGYSRQEAGENPKNIAAYYWGRMNFTQTTSYIGFLPWLLVPLPLLFRRDRYTWLALAGIIGGILFSMGKYTIFYQLLFEYFPGINKFRVPKMMMFIPVLGLGVLAARGLDCLRDETVRQTIRFRRYLWGATLVPMALLLCYGIITVWETRWVNLFIEYLAQPTRYEQGIQLVGQRWENIKVEMLIAAGFTAAHAAMLLFTRIRGVAAVLPFLLLVLYIADVGRVNAKFLFLVDVPQKSRGAMTPAMQFIARDSKQYRTLPLATDPMQYVVAKIPVLFTSHPVQIVRWQEYLDNLILASPMADIMNLKYLVLPAAQYQAEKGQFGDKFTPVFQSPDGSEVVLQNSKVLPKAWLVTEVLQVSQPGQALGLLQSPVFDPVSKAIVESPPPIPLGGSGVLGGAGRVEVRRYEGERIDIAATTPTNSLLVLGEKYYKGWKATMNGKPVEIQRVNFLLRGIYLPPGSHEIKVFFDPIAFKVGKYLTLSSFAVFAGMLLWEWRRKKDEVYE